MATLNFDVLWRDHQAQQGMKNLSDRSEKLRGRLKAVGVAGGVALAAVGVAATKFAVSSVKAYAEAETSQLRLSEAYRKFPKLADTSIGSLRQLNTELAKKTRFDDDATASGQAVLAQFNLTGKQITQLTPLLQDYAAKTGKDLPTAAKDLGKAVLGQGRSLKNVGINFKDTGTQAGNLEQITKGLRTQVGGFAEKEGKTAAGQSEILKNQWGELQEAVGAKLLPLLVRFAKWVSTHRDELVTMFIDIGKGGIQFGITLTKVVVAGIRLFGSFADAIDEFTGAQVDNMGHFLNVATAAFGWLPDLGPKLQAANINFAMFAANARTNIHKSGDAARGFADGIEGGLLPTLTRAGTKLDEVGRKHIISAQARAAANKAATAIRGIGDAADGSQIKLKHWNDRTKLGTTAQNNLEYRIKAARIAMLDQREAGIKAGASQGLLTKRWNAGKEALYREFVQMGLSKAEAHRLAEQYGKVPGKKHTKYSTSGAGSAEHHAKRVGDLIRDIPKLRDVEIKFSTNAYRIGKTKFAVNLTAPSSVGRSAAGGLIRGPGSGTSDSILGLSEGGVATSWVSNGEYVVNARQTRKNIDVLEAINGGQDLPRRAGGGIVTNYGAFPKAAVQLPRVANWFESAFAKGAGSILGKGLADGLAGTIMSGGGGAFGGVGAAGVGHLARAALAQVGSTAWGIGKCLMFVRQMAGAPGGVYDASAAWSNARYKHRGDRNPPSGVPVYWGGGHGHIAVSIGGGQIVGTDFPRMGRIGRSTLGRINSAWGKPYRGWTNDVNGRVTSRYGLSSGGVLGVGVGEHGPERVLSAAQTRTFDRMVRVMDSRGAGNTYVVNISAPNYVGSRQELRKTLVDMTRSGAFEVVKR